MPKVDGNEWVVFLREQGLEAALAGSGLPEASRAAVRRSLQGEYGPGDVEAAIAAQRKLVAELQKDQVVSGLDKPLDGGRVGGMLTSVDRVTIALEALLAGQQPERGVRPLSGIREAYVLLSGDHDMRGMFVIDRSRLEDGYDPESGRFDWENFVMHRLLIEDNLR